MSTTAAARIPQELYAYIIEHLSIDVSWSDTALPHSDIHGSGVVVGSLVCMHWAQRCRKMLFQGRVVHIRSMKQAVGFRNLVMSASCEGITPIVDLIERVDVVHHLNRDGRSWFQIIGALMPRLPRSKFGTFSAFGPRSKLPAAFRLQTPFWAAQSLPQFVRPYRTLHLETLHVTSAADVVRFVNRFPHLLCLHLNSVTWDKNVAHALTLPRVVTRPSAPYCSLRSMTVEYCMDKLLLWRLVALGSKPRTPLQLLSPDDQQAVFNLVTDAYNANIEVNEYNTMKYELTECGERGDDLTWLRKLTTHTEISGPLTVHIDVGPIELHLFCEKERNMFSMSKSLRVTGCILVVYSRDKNTWAKYAKHTFWSSVLQLSSLRSLVLGIGRVGRVETSGVDNVDALMTLTEAHPELRKPASEKLRYYQLVTLEEISNDGSEWVGRDPLSLELTSTSAPLIIAQTF